MGTKAEVLVLDDESIVCERLKEHLEKINFLVEFFQECLEDVRPIII